MENKKKTDPIPDEFGSYEEAAEFWDSHDTTDYLEYLTPVEVTAEFRGRLYELGCNDSSRVRVALGFFSGRLPKSERLRKSLREITPLIACQNYENNYKKHKRN